jgi:hypothetical protein
MNGLQLKVVATSKFLHGSDRKVYDMRWRLISEKALRFESDRARKPAAKGCFVIITHKKDSQ